MSTKQYIVQGITEDEYWECEIDQEQACAFKTFCDLINDVNDDQSTILQVNECGKETFEHALEANARLPTDAENDQNKDNPAYLYLKGLDVHALTDVVMLIDFLHHARLLTLACKAIASHLEGKSRLEIEAMLKAT